VNVCSPNPVPNRDFVRALGAAMSRPALIPVPAAALRLVLGAEFASQVLLASQRVVPTRLAATGFEWEHPTVAEAFAALFD
jgi:uncharacterized protein